MRVALQNDLKRGSPVLVLRKASPVCGEVHAHRIATVVVVVLAGVVNRLATGLVGL